MMFFISKIVGFLTLPANMLLVILLMGLGLMVVGRMRAARWLLGFYAAAAVALTLLPVGSWLLKPLESRFPEQPLPEHVDGIVVLGGAIDPVMTAARGAVSLNAAAERVTAFAVLAQRYPKARLIYSGGSGSLVNTEIKEADYVPDFMAELGIRPERVLRENQSRNTAENARYSHALAQPKPGETWLLITSAAHMPRSIGAFRAVGWQVMPVPVSFRTDDRLPPAIPGDFAKGINELSYALYEWRGLIFYRLAGWTGDLFPAPEK